MNDVKKFYPTHDELQTINCCLLCTEEGCTAIFSSQSNLNLHLVKTHKKEWSPDSSNKNKEYYCPNATCLYNSTKNFKTFKQLKQHYLKVHSNKSYMCEKCNSGFATASAQYRHTDYCGINFKCCECETSYPCYESLITHGRRKKHVILEKSSYKPNQELVEKSNSGSDIKLLKKASFILPKLSTSLQLISDPYVVKSDNFSFEKSIQTDRKDLPQFRTKHTQVYKNRSPRIWSSKHSQTAEFIKLWSSAETQTIGDYVNKKRKLCDLETFSDCQSKSEEDILQKSIKTQTKFVASNTKSCNTSFVMDESEYDPFIQRSSSSTQTVLTTLPSDVLYSTSTSTHDSIHTDTSDLNFLFLRSNSQSDLHDDMTNFDSSTFLNCNIETQTDFMFDNDVLNEDCYSNIETQTSDSSADFDDILGFTTLSSQSSDDTLSNTIHTQTIYDFVSCSVESQTMMSRSKLQGSSFRDMANIETQTEVDLRLLLESIDA